MKSEMILVVKRWKGNTSPSEADIMNSLHEQDAAGYRWSNAPGYTYQAHSHAYHKIIYVVRGSITFGLPDEGEVYLLKAGDRLDLPAGTPHEAQVGTQGVTCFEAHYKS
jgi:quercetin dioxygenase-like cupin family protein